MVYAYRSWVRTLLTATSQTGATAARAYALARADAHKALALAPRLPDAYMALGLERQHNFDLGAAAARYRQAEVLAADNPLPKFMQARVLASLGRLDEAIALNKAGVQLDPLQYRAHMWRSRFELARNAPDAADAALDRAVALQPDGVDIDLHTQRATIALWRGDAATALREARLEPGGLRDEIIVQAQQIGADRGAADRALQRYIAQHGERAPFEIAKAYAIRKEPDPMFAWLERARLAHQPQLIELLYDPFLLRYRNDPRFAALRQQLGLPAE